jgi:hypothetical protein
MMGILLMMVLYSIDVLHAQDDGSIVGYYLLHSAYACLLVPQPRIIGANTNKGK